MDRYERWAAYEVEPVDYEDWEERRAMTALAIQRQHLESLTRYKGVLHTNVIDAIMVCTILIDYIVDDLKKPVPGDVQPLLDKIKTDIMAEQACSVGDATVEP